MAINTRVVQKSGKVSIEKQVTDYAKLGFALYGSPFELYGTTAQLMVRDTSKAIPTDTGKYTIVQGNMGITFENTLASMITAGWQLYGDPLESESSSMQAMIFGPFPTYHEPSGGSPVIVSSKETGYFDYQNTLIPQKTVSTVWSTLNNNGLGAFTQTAFAPKGVTKMLDAPDGRILLNELSVGDQVDVQYTINAMGYSNGVDISFRHLAGQIGQQYELPLGSIMRMQSGAGVLTGAMSINGSFTVRDENTRLGGVLPQVRTAGVADITYTSAYIRVTRNSIK